MENKRILLQSGLLILLLSIMLISGCTGGGSYVSDNDFRSGYTAIQLGFVDGAPPDEISEDSLIQLGVEVHNAGGYNIEKGFLTLNYDDDYLNLNTQNRQSINLEGRNKFNPTGEQRSYFFDGETRLLESQSQYHDIPVIANFCYQYGAVLNDKICIDRSYSNNKEQGASICSYSDKSYSGQGGPVGVSSVKMLLTSGNGEGLLKPIFNIELTHNGRGLVIAHGAYGTACTTGGSRDLINKVNFAAYLSDRKLDCGDSVVTLINGKAKLRCEGQEVYEYSMPYEAPLSVNMTYAYSETLTSSFRITR